MAQDYLGFTHELDGLWAMIRAALTSVGNLAVIPMQDYLGLGSQARMNTPSTVGPQNWSWRMEPGAYDQGLAAKIARLTDITARTAVAPETPKKKKKKKDGASEK